MKAICTVFGAVAVVLALVGVASATTIFSENFDEMTGSVMGTQDGWAYTRGGSSSCPIGIGSINGSTQILDENIGGDSGVLTTAYHSLGSQANLSSSVVSTLQWDAWWGNNSYLGFGSVSGSTASARARLLARIPVAGISTSEASAARISL